MLAPINHRGVKDILDVGSGSGSSRTLWFRCLIVLGRWAIEVAREFPTAHVIGMDISPIHLSAVDIPPNCEFIVGNLIKDLEGFEEGSLDLVHSRHVN